MRADHNELLTRVGPDTPGGALLRRYWQPVALLDEFDPALDPRMAIRPVKPVRLLGQALVLFRQADGRFGLIDRDCPHRGADLAYGRNEGDGLRCPFHGWKFDASGQCIDTPAEPKGSTLCQRIRQRSYPLIQKAGTLFAWLGPEDQTPPPFPALDCFVAPESHSFAFKGLWHCNWLQAFEVGIDPAHASFLHRFFFDESLDDSYGRQFRGASVGELDGQRLPMTKVMREFDQPDISFESMPYGLRLTALRHINDHITHVRITNAVFPQTFVIPLSETMTITQMHVPVDDTHNHWYAFFTSFAEPVNKTVMRDQRLATVTLPDYIPNAGRHNQWGFDPQEQQTRTYLGMGESDINVHDQWACESMGAIQDRTREHLGTTDKVIIAHRRLLRQAIESVQAGGTPQGDVADPAVISQRIGPDTVDGIAPTAQWAQWWREAVAAKRQSAPWPAAQDVPPPSICLNQCHRQIHHPLRSELMSFAQRCITAAYGTHAWQAHEAATAETVIRIQQSGVELVRLGWADLHGVVRSKTLTVQAALRALHSGIGMPSTLILKDSGDRTAYKVFDAGGTDEVPAGFAGGGNVMLLPDPQSFQALPWLNQTGWLRCDAWFQNGQPVALEPRRVLQTALQSLAQRGYRMVCGLEVEFHIYRLTGASDHTPAPELDPQLADWPGPVPRVALLHPGFHMLSDAWFDQTEPALRIVQRTAQALDLPLTSLEVEMGPSQVEAVFDATDALTAADQMVLFRNAVRQALRREGYHATFMCRPPFPRIMSSGWHLHQSLVHLDTGQNAFTRTQPALQTQPQDATHTLSDVGAAWLAGLLAHAQGMAALCVPTGNGFARFQPNALAPCAAVWGQDNRGAMLRVVGTAGDAATRIENRLGEPAANPYLYIAAQLIAGLDGLTQALTPPPATTSPYATEAHRLPAHLADALTALHTDTALCAGLGQTWVNYYTRIKQSELQRRAQAADPQEFDRREYFSRI